jgi:integrase
LALTARDNRRRAERVTANDWRRQREYPLLPDFPTDGYTDHLTPIVLLALNTGMRRGELFHLKWRDVDLVTLGVTVRGAGAKSGRTRHIPLNTEAHDVITRWQPEQVDPDGLVFPGDDGDPLVTLKTAWLAVAKVAKLNGFRFHDLRHTFASKLVQAGVDLASVRALLGHSDFALTLRYAHLAAENLTAAVAKLNGTR